MELKSNFFLVFFLLSIFTFMLFSGGVKCLVKTAQALINTNSEKSLDLMFKNIGSYSGETKDGQSYTKQYYIPKFFTVYWHEVKGVCSQYDMEFATFETKEESETILDILRKNGTNNQPSWNYYFIGGVATVPKSKADWFWADSGEHIDYDLRWVTNQPDNTNGVEFCLSISKNLFAYNDMPCDSHYAAPSAPQSFICQKKIVL